MKSSLKILLISKVLLVGCVGTVVEQEDNLAPTDDPYYVLDEAYYNWEKDFGELGQECREQFLRIEIQRGENWTETAELCGEGRAGCFWVESVNNEWEIHIVYTKDDEERYVLYHEFTHWALWCSTGSLDGNHNMKAVWQWSADITGARNRV